MPKLAVFILIAITFNGNLNAQPNPGVSEPHRYLTLSKLRSIIRQSFSLPIEYQADIAFTIIDGNPDVLTKKEKAALLNSIFERANRAHYPSPLVEAAGLHGDTLSHVDTTMLNVAKLSSIDIQSRAIQRTLKISPLLTRRLLGRMGLEEMRASCKDGTVENPSLYYETGINVSSLRPGSNLADDEMHRLQVWVSNMHIPAEIPTLANLIAQSRLGFNQRKELSISFLSSLNQINPTDREMSALEDRGDLSEGIRALSISLTHAGLRTDPLISAYRAFLIRGLTGERCGDHTLDRNLMAARYNALLNGRSDRRSLSSIQLQSSHIGPSAALETIPFDKQTMIRMGRIRSAQQVRVAEKYRTGHEGTLPPPASDVKAVIDDTDAMIPEKSACPKCYFEAKVALYTMLVDALPPGPQLEGVADREVQYLSFNAMERENPVVWLTLVKQVINSSRKSDNSESAETAIKPQQHMTTAVIPSSEAVQIRKCLNKSKDPIIRMYMVVGDVLHLPYLTPEKRLLVR